MRSYTITLTVQSIATNIKAESAVDALDVFCDQHPDDPVGFQRGGLRIDEATLGDLWASVRTDAGRLVAEAETE